MSQRIKERKKKEKKIKFYSNLIIVFLVISFLVLFSWYIYSKFFAKKKIEAFFPQESFSFFLVKSNFTTEQGDRLRKLGTRFGDEKYFQNFLEDLIFPKLRDQKLDIPEEKFTGWRGDYIAVGNIKLSNIENISIFVLEVKNPDLSEEFLKILEENLNKRGYVVTSEDFRGYKVTSNRGLSEISYAVFEDYLLVSEKPDGVKKMIDTALGKFASIYEEDNYKTVKKKLDEEESIVFSFFDPLELARSVPFLNTKAIEPIEKVGLRNRSDLRMGMSFIPEVDSIEAKLYSQNTYGNKDKLLGSKLKFAKMIPADVLLYFEDNDFKSMIEGLFLSSGEEGADTEVEIAAMKKLIEMETGIKIDDDIFEYLSKNYALYMLPSSNKEQLDLISIFETEDKSDFADNLNKIEDATLNLLKKTGNEEMNDRRFTDHSYQNITYRYLNLPDDWNIDLTYALVDDYFFIATSDQSSKNAIDVILERIPSKLEENKTFKDSYNLSKNNKSDQFFYADVQSFIQFMNHHIDFEYENLDRKVKILESLSFVKEEKRRDNFYNLFLRVK